VDGGAICDALVEAAAPFDIEPVRPRVADLRQASLYGALTGDVPGDAYGVALKFVYEGYLLHYRQSRVAATGAPLETRLLAGDHFDARGLHEVARRGDVDAAELLTRLMSACSWLRSEGLPAEWDDDLWALTVAGIAVLRGGGNAVAALNAFDEIERLISRDRAARLPDTVRRLASTLPLRDPRPLRVALGLDEPPAEATVGAAASAGGEATAGARQGATGDESGAE
jgi:hypothetical protein